MPDEEEHKAEKVKPRNGCLFWFFIFLGVVAIIGAFVFATCAISLKGI